MRAPRREEADDHRCAPKSGQGHRCTASESRQGERGSDRPRHGERLGGGALSAAIPSVRLSFVAGRAAIKMMKPTRQTPATKAMTLKVRSVGFDLGLLASAVGANSKCSAPESHQMNTSGRRMQTLGDRLPIAHSPSDRNHGRGYVGPQGVRRFALYLGSQRRWRRSPPSPLASTNHDLPHSHPHHDSRRHNVQPCPFSCSRLASTGHAMSRYGSTTNHRPMGAAMFSEQESMRYVHCQCAPAMVLPESVHPPYRVRNTLSGLRRSDMVAGHTCPRRTLP